MNEPRVTAVRRLAPRGRETSASRPRCARSLRRGHERMPEEDASMLIDVLLDLMTESQLDAVAHGAPKSGARQDRRRGSRGPRVDLL